MIFFLSFFFFLKIFPFFSDFVFLSALGLRWACGCSLFAESGGSSLAVGLRLLIAVACLLEDHGLQGAQASVAVARRLSCSGARGIFLDRGSSWCPPALHGGFSTTGPPGKSLSGLLCLKAL